MAEIYGNPTVTPINPDAFSGGGSFEVDLEYNPKSENAQSGKAVDEAIKQTKNIFANTLKGTKSGSAISVNDVSVVEHSLGVSVKRKNLLQTTPTRKLKAAFNECFYLPKGTYTVSMDFANANSWRFTITLYDSNKNLITDNASTTTHLKGIGTGHTLNYSSGNGGIYQNAQDVTSNYLIFETDNDYFIGINFYFDDTKNATVSNAQLELGSTATEYTPYVADLSTVEVSRFGKNLFNQASTETGTISVGFSNTIPRNLEHGKWYTNLTLSGYYDYNRAVAVSLNGDNVTVKTNDINESARLYGLSKAFKCKPNTTYTLSYRMNNGATKNASGIGFYNADKIHTSFVYCDSGNSFTTPDNCYWILVCFHGNSEATEVTYSDIQLELGNKATEYEPYTEPQTAIANTDGTVEGFTSLSPNMTLVSDTEGVVINLEYNVDTKMYIDNELAKIKAELSAAIVNS